MLTLPITTEQLSPVGALFTLLLLLILSNASVSRECLFLLSEVVSSLWRDQRDQEAESSNQTNQHGDAMLRTHNGASNTEATLISKTKESAERRESAANAAASRNSFAFQNQSVESELLFPFNSPITKNPPAIYSSSNSCLMLSAIPLAHVNSGNSVISTNSKLTKNIKRQQKQQQLRETRERQQQKLQEARQEKQKEALNLADPRDEIFENQIFYFGDAQEEHFPSKTQRNSSLSLEQINDPSGDQQGSLHGSFHGKLCDVLSDVSYATQECCSYISNLTQELPASYKSDATIEHPPSYRSIYTQPQGGSSDQNGNNSSQVMSPVYSSQSMLNNTFRANALMVLKQEKAFSKRLSNANVKSQQQLPTYRDLMKENPSSKLKTNNDTLHQILDNENYLFEKNELKLLNNRANSKLGVIKNIDNYSSSSDEEFQLPLKTENSLDATLSKTRSGKSKERKHRKSSTASIGDFIGAIIQRKEKPKGHKRQHSSTKSKKQSSKRKNSTTNRSSKSSAAEEDKISYDGTTEKSEQWLLTQFLIDEYSVHGRNYVKEGSNDSLRRLREDMFESSSDEEDLYSYK